MDTTFALLPTPDTVSAARLEIDRSWSAFHQIVAPAPVQTGFLLAASVAVVGGAFLADWAAFRLWSAREALVPSVTLFVFATLLADDRHRTLCAVLMVGAALAFVLTHRVVTLERSEGWVSEGRARAGRSMLVAGALLAVGAVVVGTLVAPLLPGADEDAIVDWRNNGDGNSARILNSPLVDIRARLVDTSNTPLFTVESDTRSYWRLAALETFDGSQWKMESETDLIADGALGGRRRPCLPPDPPALHHRPAPDRVPPGRLPAGRFHPRRRRHRPLRPRDLHPHQRGHDLRRHDLRGHVGAPRLHPRGAPRAPAPGSPTTSSTPPSSPTTSARPPARSPAR